MLLHQRPRATLRHFVGVIMLGVALREVVPGAALFCRSAHPLNGERIGVGRVRLTGRARRGNRLKPRQRTRDMLAAEPVEEPPELIRRLGTGRVSGGHRLARRAGWTVARRERVQRLGGLVVPSLKRAVAGGERGLRRPVPRGQPRRNPRRIPARWPSLHQGVVPFVRFLNPPLRLDREREVVVDPGVDPAADAGVPRLLDEDSEASLRFSVFARVEGGARGPLVEPCDPLPDGGTVRPLIDGTDPRHAHAELIGVDPTARSMRTDERGLERAGVERRRTLPGLDAANRIHEGGGGGGVRHQDADDERERSSGTGTNHQTRVSHAFSLCVNPARHYASSSSRLERFRGSMRVRYTWLALLLLVAAGCGGDETPSDDPDVGSDVQAGVDAADADEADLADDVDANAADDTTNDPPDGLLDVADAPDEDTGDSGGEDAEDADGMDGEEVADTGDTEIDALDDVEVEDDAGVDAPDGAEDDATPDASLACRGSGDGPFEMALGTGIDAFESLADGDTVIMAEGIQGGFHIWGGLSGTGFDPEGGEADFRLRNAADEVVGALIWTGDYRCDAATGRWFGAGLTVFLDFSVWPPEVDGERWTMCVNTTLGSGETFSDCVEVVTSCCDWLFGPPDDA